MRKLEVEIERAKDRISDLNASLDEAQADLEFNEDEIEEWINQYRNIRHLRPRSVGNHDSRRGN